MIFITAFVIILEGNSCHWNTFITAAKWTLLLSFELLHNDQYSHIKPVYLVWRLLALHCLCCIVTNFTFFFYYPYNLLSTCNLDLNEEHSRFPKLPSTPMELFNLLIQGQHFSWTVLNLGCNDFFLITPQIYLIFIFLIFSGLNKLSWIYCGNNLVQVFSFSEIIYTCLERSCTRIFVLWAFLCWPICCLCQKINSLLMIHQIPELSLPHR